MRISLMMKPHDGDSWIKRVLDVPTKPRTRIPPLSEKDKKWSHVVGKFSLAAVIKHRELRKLTPQRLEERERLIEEKRKKLQISRDYSFLFNEEENAERAKIKTQTQRTKCYFRSDNTNRKFGSGSQDLKHNGDRCDKVQDFKANTQKASQQSVHHVNQSRFHNHNGHSRKVQDLNNNNGGRVQDFKADSQKGSQQSVHHVNQTHYHYGDRKIVQDWNHRHKVDGRRGSQEYIHPVKQSYNNYSENKKVQDWDRNYKVDTQRVLKERGHHRIHRMPYGTSFNYRQDLGYTRNTFRYYPEDSAGMARINRKETRNRWESENRQRKRKREVQESLHKPRLTHCY